MSETISYKMDCADVDWVAMKQAVADDNFDNGRSPEQLRRSFENSAVICIAYAGDRIIGTARALADGVCNAYIVDVWTESAYRHRGIGSHMVTLVCDRLPGHHIYLFTDDAVDFYHKLGFATQGIGMGKVVGQWLNSSTA
jgi:predicted GNAT family acetyltransferase